MGVHAARGLKRRRLAHIVEQSGKAQGKAWLYAVHRVKAVVKHVVLVDISVHSSGIKDEHKKSKKEYYTYKS